MEEAEPRSEIEIEEAEPPDPSCRPAMLIPSALYIEPGPGPEPF